MTEEDAEIGNLALEKGLVNSRAMDEALADLTSDDVSLTTILRTRALLSPEQIVTLRNEAHRRITDRTGVPPTGPAPREKEPALETLPAAPSPEAPPPGEVAQVTGVRIGKYVRASELGKGSAAVVWKAWDTDAKRWVALKLLTETGGGAEGIDRFLKEARKAQSLAHPGIVAIYESGRLEENGGGRAYIAMEYVDGVTADRYRGDGIPIQRAAEIVRDAALAVAEAHAQGVIHRDLKPRNIFVGRDQRVRVTDFGLAQLAGILGPDDDAMLSRSVKVQGTPSYMSPEQALGRTSDIRERSDVYSLGATLYFLLTGRPPFDAGNPMKTCFAVVREALVPPSKFNAAVKADIERVVLRALSKDPVRRYDSAMALAADLDRFLQNAPVLSDDQLRLTQGLAALHAGRLEEAVHMFKDLIRISEASGSVSGGRKAVLRSIEEGENGLSLAIERQQKNFDIRTNRGVYRFAKAILRSLDGVDPREDSKNAMADFISAADLRSEHTPARVNRANILIFGGRYGRDSGKDVTGIFRMALDDLTAAISFDDTCSPAYHNRGIVHFYIGREVKSKGGDPEPHYRDAINDFSRAAELEQTYAYIFKDLGVVKVALAKHLHAMGIKVKSLFVEAVMHLDMSCTLNPSIYGAYYSRGQAHFALKDFLGAIADFKRCLELDPLRDQHKLRGLIEQAQKLLKSRPA